MRIKTRIILAIAAALLAFGLDASRPDARAVVKHAVGSASMAVPLRPDGKLVDSLEAEAAFIMAADKVDGLPLPRELREKVRLWEAVYGKYDHSRLIAFNRDHPSIIYFDVSDRPRGKDRALARLRARLYVLHDVVNHCPDPVAAIREKSDAEELLKLYHKFDRVPGRDRFALAARSGAIGVLRGRRNELESAITRAAPYMPAMERTFTRRGMPASLTRLVYVESMFDRDALSSRGAAGAWQILYGTARPRMVINDVIDERRNPLKGAEMAADILADGHERLGSWPLAVTAYNAGTNRMARAVKRTGSDTLIEVLDRYNHAAFGYAVENFYARLLGVIRAEKIIAGNKIKSYAPDPSSYDLVKLPRAYTLAELSRKIGMEPRMLVLYNPGWTKPIEKGWVPIPAGYALKTPKGSGRVVAMAVGAKMDSILAAGKIHETPTLTASIGYR